MCRTGRFWAYEHAGIKPDAISIAKSLANGIPMGAMLATDEMSRGFEAGSHATTFGGGALASAVARKVIEIMLRDRLWERAEINGGELIARLEDLRGEMPDKIRDVRGQGLMIGVELVSGAPEVWKELLNRGFICSLSHNVTLRLLPALTIAREDLDSFAKTLKSILKGG